MEAYRSSTALKKLQRAKEQGQPLRLAFLDVDNTWSGRSEDQQSVRESLESQHYVVGVVTNRTSEMSMSWHEREKSYPQVRNRPPAKFRFPDTQKYQTVDPADVPELTGLLDPDIIASTFGTELLVKQSTGGYQPDNTYIQRLPASPETWHLKAQQLLERCAQQEIEFALYHPLDVTPTDLRIEAVSATRQQRDQLVAALTKLEGTTSPHIAYDNTTVIITPAQASKEDATDHITNTVMRLMTITPGNVQVLFAGDSMADAAMGFFSAAGTQATFIIPGGTQLTEELQSGKLKKVREQMTKTKNDATLPTGVYWFPKGSRTIVIGDEAFPGTAGPETLIAYLSQPT